MWRPLQVPARVEMTALSACAQTALALRIPYADFSKPLSEFETQADALPVEMEWCGNDGVALQWWGLLMVVGPSGEHASWPVAEDDKVRGLAARGSCAVCCFKLNVMS